MSIAKVQDVTPEQALAWLNKASYDKQRTIRSYWVKYLAEEMKRGNFEQDTTLVFMRTGGTLELVDGQHRLSAVCQSGISQRFVVVIRDVTSDDDVANAYYRLDQSLKRTVSDQYRVLALNEKMDLTPTELNSFGQAISFIANGFQRTNSAKILHPNDRFRLMDEYADAARSYFIARMGCPKEIAKSLKRSSTVSVALVTYRYSAQEYGKSKIDDFWTGAIFDDGIPSGDARKAANKHFWTTDMVGSVGRKPNHMSAGKSARVLARCFNAYIARDPLKYPQGDETKPIKIFGSPFTGT